MTEIFSLGVLVFLFIVQVVFVKRETVNLHIKGIRRWFSGVGVKKIALAGFLASFLFILFYYFFLVYRQYLAWRDGGGTTIYLVPPYQGAGYVLGYHFTRFAMYHLVSLMAALVFTGLMIFFNKKRDYRFFYDEEPYLAGLSIFLLGNKEWGYAWIYYLVVLFGLSVIGSLVISHWLKKSERFSLYWLWIPTAIGVILVQGLRI